MRVSYRMPIVAFALPATFAAIHYAITLLYDAAAAMLFACLRCRFSPLRCLRRCICRRRYYFTPAAPYADTLMLMLAAMPAAAHAAATSRHAPCLRLFTLSLRHCLPMVGDAAHY